MWIMLVGCAKGPSRSFETGLASNVTGAWRSDQSREWPAAVPRVVAARVWATEEGGRMPVRVVRDSRVTKSRYRCRRAANVHVWRFFSRDGGRECNVQGAVTEFGPQRHLRLGHGRGTATVAEGKCDEEAVATTTTTTIASLRRWRSSRLHDTPWAVFLLDGQAWIDKMKRRG